jgi:hypothetical protein
MSSRSDFDFIFGRWIGHNEKLVDQTDPDCTEWIHFDAIDEATPILRGLGHIHRMTAPDVVGGDSFEGFTLRLFDPAALIWRIWWSSTRVPGMLDTPLVGTFNDGHGVFESVDVIGGRPAGLRFEWFADPAAPVWQQSFSFDAGVTWRLNWIMRFERED